MKTRFTLFISILLLALSAWSRPEGEITAWFMGEEGNRIGPLIQAFEKENPGTRIHTQSVPWDGAHDRLITSVAGNIPPDVTLLGTTWVAEFAAMDVLIPLDKYLERSSILASEDFYESSLSTCQWEGHLYTLPWYVDVRVVFYRSDILTKAGWDHYPKTWKELEQLSQDLTLDFDGDGKTDQYTINFSYRDEQHFLPFIWQAGGDLLDETYNRAIFDSPQSRKALAFYQSLFHKGYNPGASNTQVNPFIAFSEGYYISWMTGPWMVGECERRLPDEMKGRWKVAMLPGDQHRTSFLGGSNLAIFRKTKNPELAWTFLEYLCRPDNQLKWNSLSGNLPASRKAWDSPSLADHPIWSVFRSQLEDAQAVPTVECWEAMAEAIKNETENLVVGNQDVDITAKKIQHSLQTILSRRRGSQGNLSSLAKPLFGLLAAVFGLILVGILWNQKHHLKSWSKWRTPVFFLSPILVHLTLFVFLPILVSLFLSFTDYDIYSIGDWKRTSFIGLRNYWEIATDSLFWKSLFNTIYFISVSGPLTIFVALGAALILNHPALPFRGIFRTGYFLPVVIPLVAIAVVWRWIYAPQHGLLNWCVGQFGMSEQTWLADPLLAMPCLILLTIWKNFGYGMVIFLAGLQAIPPSLYEAASIDGAGPWRTFKDITLPLLQPTLLFMIIITTIGYMQFFAEPYVMTNLGGPQNRTLSVVLYLYKEGFKFFHIGYASAIAYTLCAAIAFLSILQFSFMRRAGGVS